MTKVILSHKLAGTAAETSGGMGLAAGTSPPSLLPRFTTPGVGGASGSGLLGRRLQAERWPVEPQDKSENKVRREQGSRCPPGRGSGGASLAPQPAPAYRGLPAPSGSKIPMALLLDTLTRCRYHTSCFFKLLSLTFLLGCAPRRIEANKVISGSSFVLGGQ